jgi:Protein of unknown function (DUF3611)
MADTLNTGSTPVAVKKIATNLQRIGRFGFLVQLAPAVISGLLLLSSIALMVSGRETKNTGGGLVFSTISLVILLASLFWFFRYTSIAGKFRDANTRPSKADTFKLLRSGAIINVLGLGFGVLGAEALVFSLFWKSLSLLNPFAVQGAVYGKSSIADLAIQPLDVLVSLANTQTMLAHFVGLSCSLWLINNLNKQPKETPLD